MPRVLRAGVMEPLKYMILIVFSAEYAGWDNARLVISS
jgi:hypothetical protein